MPIAVAVWSFTLKPGEPQSLVPPHDVVITNIALGDELEDQNSRTTVKLSYLSPVNVDGDDEEEDEDSAGGGTIENTVLCSLTPGKIEQATVNITLEGEEEYLLQAVGKNTIFLTGNYVDQSPDNVPYNDESEPEDEDDFDLRDVSSDVEIDPKEMDAIENDEDDEDDSHRFEEVSDEPAPKAANSKRPRDSDMSAADEKPSKAQEKKAKKQKVASGEAVATGEIPAKAEAVPDKKEKKAKKEQKKSTARELPNGLKIADEKVGEGPQAKNGQTLSMRYIGKLQNGRVFDSNTKGKPFTFTLGKGEVIKGWDQGLMGMQAGGERLLVIPPALAYGKRKMGDIPPNSTLTFEVKLLSIK
ncbi:hypothetical protein K488DRAFT_78473 [Vararia minispora EC-137]|uniref:Uncharacterized protein n=1 Tax=Vararia minispora EC-137 TaxID=1314806 RepID=A0ACB8QLJ7_9AGAM|nr:hypothetical protein K488DRAFT_78473 [Vararia minispora EC-137]